MSEALERRVRQIRSRSARRNWEARQSRHAMGTWVRVRRALSRAESVYEIDEARATELLEEGFSVEPFGEELEPKKTLIFIPRERLARLRECREIPVRIGPEFLAARWLVAVEFPR